MKVSQLLDRRRDAWRELELLCRQLDERRLSTVAPETISRFARLYRAACADLALADAYQLPPETATYLDHLVGRAHNQLYRSKAFRWREWGREMFLVLPRKLVRDRYLWLSFALFWGVFGLSCLLAYSSEAYRREVLGEQAMSQLQDSFAKPIERVSSPFAGTITAFYVMHNVGIGLRCFTAGLLLGIGGLFVTLSNALNLGAAFGFMFTVSERTNFIHFVTAHGPFELTAIVFASAAGMRLGFSLIATEGLTRGASLGRAAREATPVMAASGALFCLAAFLEGFLSPSAAPYAVKVAAAVASTVLIAAYVLGLGLLAGRPRLGDDSRSPT
jgi:uncharacterized membrane protein SpoIIM required for sporulation